MNRCFHSDIDFMGYSLRSDTWRFTQWVKWNKTSLEPIWKSVALNETELYDHTNDNGTNLDIAMPTGSKITKTMIDCIISLIHIFLHTFYLFIIFSWL